MTMEVLLSSAPVGRKAWRWVFSITTLAMSLAIPVTSWASELPKSFGLEGPSQTQVDQKTLSPIDRDRLLAEDDGRSKDHPFRFAVPEDVHFTLENSGTWQALPDGSRIWRLRINSPGARNLSLGITRFDISDGAKLWVYDPSHGEVRGPYTARNRSTAGSLFTPVIQGEEIIVEAFVPAGAAKPTIEIGRVNKGYRGFEKN